MRRKLFPGDETFAVSVGFRIVRRTISEEEEFVAIRIPPVMGQSPIQHIRINLGDSIIIVMKDDFSLPHADVWSAVFRGLVAQIFHAPLGEIVDVDHIERLPGIGFGKLPRQMIHRAATGKTAIYDFPSQFPNHTRCRKVNISQVFPQLSIVEAACRMGFIPDLKVFEIIRFFP